VAEALSGKWIGIGIIVAVVVFPAIIAGVIEMGSSRRSSSREQRDPWGAKAQEIDRQKMRLAGEEAASNLYSDSYVAPNPGRPPDMPKAPVRARMVGLPPSTSSNPQPRPESNDRDALYDELLAKGRRAERINKLVSKRLYPDGIQGKNELETRIKEKRVQRSVDKLLNNETDPLPPTGILARKYVGEGVAPLEIKTRPGSNYYVKVMAWTTKAEVMTAIIQGGQPFETALPIGSYEIKYAAGQNWYGPVLDFGEGASYSRCDDRFDFTQTYDGYNGYTIELILQRDGNLRTETISADEF
jgi:hypothetical protein